MRSVIFVAPPAAGKGTQADMLCKKYHIPHISTGEILREEMYKESIIGQEIKEVMASGKLVSDHILYALLRNRLQQPDCNNGYVLDGFPRNVNQAIEYEKILLELGKELGDVILIDVPRERLEQRIIGRLSCNQCGKIYNQSYEDLKPKEVGICDICGTSLTKRSDDTIETYDKRYQTYLESTEPLLDYYKKKGVLFTIISNDNILDTFKEVEAILTRGVEYDNH